MGERLRPTSDANLLGFGELTGETLAQIFKEIAAQAVEADSVEFDANSRTSSRPAWSRRPRPSVDHPGCGSL
jgi:hypothetical protein